MYFRFVWESFSGHQVHLYPVTGLCLYPLILRIYKKKKFLTTGTKKPVVLSAENVQKEEPSVDKKRKLSLLKTNQNSKRAKTNEKNTNSPLKTNEKNSNIHPKKIEKSTNIQANKIQTDPLNSDKIESLIFAHQKAPFSHLSREDVSRKIRDSILR